MSNTRNYNLNWSIRNSGNPLLIHFNINIKILVSIYNTHNILDKFTVNWGTWNKYVHLVYESKNNKIATWLVFQYKEEHTCIYFRKKILLT
jgi:hypothetical protein